MDKQKQLITEIMNDDAKDGLYKQQTAVEWIINEADKLKIFRKASPISLSELDELIEQAKQMHREQIEQAYKAGDTFPAFYNNASDYYTKTYGE